MKDLSADKNGTSAIEYAVIASLISVVIVTAMTTIGAKLSAMFVTVTSWSP